MSNHTPIQLPLAIEGLTVEIPLTKGYVAIVDAVDADLLEFKWQASVTAEGVVYALRHRMTNKKNTTFYLHRVILERMLGRSQQKGELCDHKDLNTLNNRRVNLRIATKRGNSTNRERQSNNTSGYKGVTYCTYTGRWRTQVYHNGKRIDLGRFDTPELAYEAYCKAATDYYGEFARFE